MRSLLMRRERKPAELLLVPMIDIFTVLVTFLLMTAVFSRIAIMQIDLPSSAAPKPAELKFRLEILVVSIDGPRELGLRKRFAHVVFRGDRQREKRKS